FAQLLARFSTCVPAQVQGATGPVIGLRSADDVTARLAQLAEEAVADPIPTEQIANINALLAIKASLPDALAELNTLAENMPAIADAVAHMAIRAAAFSAAGIDLTTVGFEAAYGLTAMEYYDGFIFGFYAQNPDWPAVATGGRYDALTRVLGQGRDVPAVGGVIRPELTAELGT
ncbi:MAG: ATP phosphoribosyltransferase regulatory subunit, partial [Planktomarina sp.]